MWRNIKQDNERKYSIYRLCMSKLEKPSQELINLNRTWFWCLWLNSHTARKDSIQVSKWWLYFMPGNKHRRHTVKGIFVLWKTLHVTYIFILLLKLSLCLLVLSWAKRQSCGAVEKNRACALSGKGGTSRLIPSKLEQWWRVLRSKSRHGQLIDILLTGWWWGQWESVSSTFFFQSGLGSIYLWAAYS